MGIRDEFLQLFNDCESDLRAYIGAMVRDPHARADVFQETSRALWETLDRYDLDRSFGAWARGIATRKMLEARRANARFPLLFPPETVEALLSAFDDTEDATAAEREGALKVCLESVPARSRTILDLRYEEGLKGAKIAQRLRMSLAAVHQTLCRVRSQLELCIRRRLALEGADAVPDSSSTSTSASIPNPPQPSSLGVLP